MLVGHEPVVGLLLVSSADVARNGLANHRTFLLQADCLISFHRELEGRQKSKTERITERRQNGPENGRQVLKWKRRIDLREVAKKMHRIEGDERHAWFTTLYWRGAK